MDWRESKWRRPVLVGVILAVVWLLPLFRALYGWDDRLTVDVVISVVYQAMVGFLAGFSVTCIALLYAQSWRGPDA